AGQMWQTPGGWRGAKLTSHGIAARLQPKALPSLALPLTFLCGFPGLESRPQVIGRAANFSGGRGRQAADLRVGRADIGLPVERLNRALNPFTQPRHPVAAEQTLSPKNASACSFGTVSAP